MTLNDYRKRHEKDVFVDAGDPFVVVIESAELYSGKDNLTHSLIHHFETVPNSKKLQTTTEMWLVTLYQTIKF